MSENTMHINNAKISIVLMLLLTSIELHAEIENEKTYGNCTVFEHVSNFDDWRTPFLTCISEKTNGTRAQIFAVNMSSGEEDALLIGLTGFKSDTKLSPQELTRKLRDSIYDDRGYYSKIKVEWRFDKEKSKNEEWTLGFNGVLVYADVEEGKDVTRSFLKRLGTSEKLAIRGNAKGADGVTFKLNNSSEAVKDFNKRIELLNTKEDGTSKTR